MSSAQPGRGRPLTARNWAPRPKGRLASTAMPRSAANGRKSFAGTAITDGIVHLDEIKALTPHDRLHFVELAIVRTRFADVPDAAGSLVAAQQGKSDSAPRRTMQLDQIETPGAECREGGGEALASVGDAVAIELGGEENSFAQSGISKQGANGLF